MKEKMNAREGEAKRKSSLTVIWWLSKANYIKNSFDAVSRSDNVFLTGRINIKANMSESLELFPSTSFRKNPEISMKLEAELISWRETLTAKWLQIIVTTGSMIPSS